MVAPFLAMQKVLVTCPKCGHEDARLAAGVKKGMRTECASCREAFRIAKVTPLIGSTGPKRRARR